MQNLKRLRLFNLINSPNVGDGLLSVCLERALSELVGQAHEISSIDLGGRSTRAGSGKLRATVLQGLEFFGPRLRSTITVTAMRALALGKWRHFYRTRLEGAEAVVLGGGNLLTDLDLNFPVKVGISFSEASRRRLPVAIYAVGVGGSWSDKGQRIVREALATVDLRYVSVRDVESKLNFERFFGSAAMPTVEVVRDPALMSARYFGALLAPASAASARIGVCITSAQAVRYHSTYDVRDDELETWYIAFIRALAATETPLTIFTNGAYEDVSSAKVVREAIGEAPRIAWHVCPTHPEDLLRAVAPCTVVAGYRLHALIAGYAFGATPLAFDWDPKVAAFMRSIDLSDCLKVPTASSPRDIAAFATSLLDRKLPLRDAVASEAFAGVRSMFQALSETR